MDLRWTDSARARAPPRRPRKTAEYVQFEERLDAICRAHSHSQHRTMHIRWFRIGERPRRARARRECALTCGGANSRISRARARLRYATPLRVHTHKKIYKIPTGNFLRAFIHATTCIKKTSQRPTGGPQQPRSQRPRKPSF